MKYNWAFCEREFHFKFNAGTSRGVLTSKNSTFLKIWKQDIAGFGLGEASPLQGLSKEFGSDLKREINEILLNLNSNSKSFDDFVNKDRMASSSSKFAIESAILNLESKEEGEIYDSPFFHEELAIPINGLVWMGSPDFMGVQIKEKLDQGYDCIKIKIGAIELEEELNLIRSIRERYNKDEMRIRVDANGAFTYDESLVVLEKLNDLDVHSIEQPIAAGNWLEMSKLCRAEICHIALDEELIGIRTKDQKIKLLDTIKPQYIVLKPGLHGGLFETSEWIAMAEERNIRWWITSALESNIGLNAIAQFTSRYPIKTHQGLGTGQLYKNNIPSPLEIGKGMIRYVKNQKWNFENLDFKPL